MSKNNKEKKQEYFLVWDIQYTLLEKYIYRVIKNSPEQACSDEEIAKKLFLTPANVEYIINDDCLKKFIQGDESRRSIASDFTELECGTVEINSEDDPKKGLLSDKTREGLQDDKLYTKIDYKKVPKQLQKFKAKEYYLMKSD